MTNNLLLAIVGTWIVTDGIYSITLYLNAPSYEGSEKQTFRKDHWVRAIRILLGLIVIWAGVVGEY